MAKVFPATSSLGPKNKTPGAGLPGWLLYFFVLLLLLLPFAEWRFIGLPLHGRPVVIDLDAYLSVSLFDVVFVLFFFASLAAARHLLRPELIRDVKLLPWFLAAALVPVIYISLQPFLPWFTSSSVNVIDTRAFMVHFTLGSLVMLVVASMTLRQLAGVFTIFYLFVVLGAFLLSFLALNEFDYFRLHYPYTNPIAISFPFTNHNVAAPFLSLCLLGALGISVVTRNKSLLIAAPAVLLPAAALTGSRSNLLILTGCLVLFCGALLWQGRRKRDSPVFNSLTLIVLGLVAGSLAIAANYDWQPVQRSVSIFANIARAPLGVFFGQPGSPRQEMWSLASSGKTSTTLTRDREYALALVVVQDGCKSTSKRTAWLQNGKRYLVRLVLDPDRERSLLELLEDGPNGAHIDRVTHQGLKFSPEEFYAFAADSGRYFTNIGGQLSSFRLQTGSPGASRVLSDLHGARAYEAPFNGGVTPVLQVTSTAVTVDTDTKHLRGYVARSSAGYGSGQARLEYELKIDRIVPQYPLDRPAMFYVGFARNTVQGLDRQILKFRNAVLVQHVRRSSPVEQHYYRSRIAEELAHLLRSGSLVGRSDRDIVTHFRESRRCAPDGVYPLAQLWSAEADATLFNPTAEGDAELLALAGENIYGGTVAWRDAASDQELSAAISTIPDLAWSSAEHLKYRGSTHNLYLDWYYYVGPLRALLFAAFVLSLNITLGGSAWRSRNSHFFPLLFSSALQVLLISAMMYAHPYLFLKYYWVFFGFASGLAINQRLSVQAS